MDQLIFASLSHTHYWYEVGMLKVPAEVPAVVIRHMPSGQSRVYWVTQLHTEGVNRRESNGTTGSDVLEVVPVTGAAFAYQLSVRLSFPTPIIGVKW